MSKGVEIPLEFSPIPLDNPLEHILPGFVKQRVESVAFLLVEGMNGTLATIDRINKLPAGKEERRMVFPDFHLHHPFTPEYVDDTANNKFRNIGKVSLFGSFAYLGDRLTPEGRRTLYVPFLAKPKNTIELVGSLKRSQQIYRTPDEILDELARADHESPYLGVQRRQITRAIIESYRASVA